MLVVHIGSGMAAQQSFFFIMSKLSSSKFCQGTQSSADESIVALLWKLPQMQSCSTNNANLENTNFDTLYKTDCWAAIHGRIRMNNVPNEANYAIMHWIIFVKYLFINFEKFWVKPGIPFTQLNQPTYSELGESNFDTFYKNYCWALSVKSNIHDQCVIWKRNVLHVSFLDIILFILLLVFQIFEIKSVFPLF